jgi:hypothetical protein
MGDSSARIVRFSRAGHNEFGALATLEGSDASIGLRRDTTTDTGLQNS